MASTITTQTPSANKKRSSSTESAKRLSTQIGQPKFWREVAPEGVTGDDRWKTWMRHLGTRRNPSAPSSLLPGNRSPLLWGINQEEISPATVQLVSALDALRLPGSQSTNGETALEASLAKWLKDAAEAETCVEFALLSLAVAQALPRLARRVSSGLWWQLLDTLWSVVHQNGNWRSDAELPPQHGWAQQLLVGELPLTLAHQFPEIRPLHQLRSNAAGALSEGLLELLNGAGLLAGPYLTVLRPLAACWTRCKAMGEKTKKGCWKRKAEDQYRWFTTQAIRLTAADGSGMLCEPHNEIWTPEFLQALLQFGGDKSDTAAVCSFAGKKLTRSLAAPKRAAVPEPADNCDWAGVAILRTDWERSAVTAAVDYSSPEMRIEVMAGQQRITSGTWDWQTSLDGQTLEPQGSWEEVCWFSDEDVDFLELAMDLSNGARLERQIVLARDEMFLLLVDYLLDTAGGSLVHRQSWPLEKHVSVRPEQETREALLECKKPFARVMPLGLPEWRADSRGGSLAAENDLLVLEHQAKGTNMACPLLFDLQKNRVSKQCTWRQLTVAESLEIQPPEVAAAYRAQCGKQQWLFYRSMAAKANRTFIGQNTSSECVVARLLAPSGEIQELLEVEG